ncbi:MAG TPA: FAD-dependent oxidoreductase [Aliidongia sp.]|nr:FAD-dependent oxidoreductase [Aliidongia sp.]
MTQHVGVIGAGIIGVTAARALQRAGDKVTLFDPNEPGAACSFGNAGHIAIDHVQPLARPDVLRSLPRLLFDPLGPLCLKWAGLPRLTPWLMRFAEAAKPSKVEAGTEALGALLLLAKAAWADEIAASRLADLFRHRGSLVIFESDRALREGHEESKILARHGVRLEMLGADAAKERLPALARSIAGGRYYPDTAHTVDPHRLVLELAERVTAEGGAFDRAAVTEIEIEGGLVRSVVAGDRRHQLDKLVLAAGAGAGMLAKRLGASAPLTRERGYHAMLAPESLALDLPITFADRGFVATPMTAGVRLAGTVELGAGKAPDWRRADILLTHMRELFGRPFTSTDRWMGDRPTLPDYLPMIGPAPLARNAMLALGHQHLGLTLAAVTGRLVAALFADAPLALDLSPFRADRFR